MNILKKWLIGVLAVLITVWLFHLEPLRTDALTLKWKSIWGVIVFVPVLAIINTFVGPIIKILSLPITCLTLGLFNFVINALLFWIAGSITGAKMTVWSALLAPIAIGIISAPLTKALIKEND